MYVKIDCNQCQQGPTRIHCEWQKYVAALGYRIVNMSDKVDWFVMVGSGFWAYPTLWYLLGVGVANIIAFFHASIA